MRENISPDHKILMSSCDTSDGRLQKGTVGTQQEGDIHKPNGGFWKANSVTPELGTSVTVSVNMKALSPCVRTRHHLGDLQAV